MATYRVQLLEERAKAGRGDLWRDVFRSHPNNTCVIPKKAEAKELLAEMRLNHSHRIYRLVKVLK